ncbi:hypothetical protein M426DRAFT_321195 [Hypoxylon sp. CI-4A]|nr:hypothetical protein M426DRAFT_321195 [Hypoxylon sp. CI-4A]
MPRPRPNHDFDIYVDQSCQGTPMDEETSHSYMEENEEASMADHSRGSDIRKSIEADHAESDTQSEYSDSNTPHVDDGGDNSSHHGTDEDVFSDKSPRSSLGSYDGASESSKAHKDMDNMTTATRSPRISDISQYEREYEKEEFVSTVRGTPRPPFRTPSDVRAMQMSSPPASVLGSPRSAKKFPTVSRLGTPSASAQYSPKRMSTPPRFKGRKEAPLVLLHVTLLPLRWVWGDLLNDLDTDGMSDQAKALRESWRLLQDRVGDTVIERGILLGHPQNDYEVLEERLLEALELPFRRRARILDCGHYLGPSNEKSLTEEEESEDESDSEHHRSSKRSHWCGTCKTDIRYNPLGEGKIFRVKIYASNGLMKAGAWEACWKEMERVDAELEPIVEPDLQEELVRLAAAQQERDIAHQEEAEIRKEVAQQLEEQHQKEKAEFMNSHFGTKSPQPGQERTESPISEEERRRRDGERMREIYGDTPPPASPRPHSREPSVHSYKPPQTPSSPRHSHETHEHKEHHHQQPPYQQASLPELMLQSVRVLMQDRKNVIIFTLGVFVLLLALRNAPSPGETTYEPVIHRMRDIPTMRRAQDVEAPQIPTVQVKVPGLESLTASSVCGDSSSLTSQYYAPSAEPLEFTSEDQSASIIEPIEPSEPVLEEFSLESVAIPQESVAPQVETELGDDAQVDAQESESAPTEQEAPAEPTVVAADSQDQEVPAPQEVEQEVEQEVAAAEPSLEDTLSLMPEPTASEASEAAGPSVSTVYEPCSMPTDASGMFFQYEEAGTVTEKKVVKVFHTVTETEVETATETVKVAATDAAKESQSQSLPLTDDEAALIDGLSLVASPEAGEFPLPDGAAAEEEVASEPLIPEVE